MWEYGGDRAGELKGRPEWDGDKGLAAFRLSIQPPISFSFFLSDYVCDFFTHVSFQQRYKIGM